MRLRAISLLVILSVFASIQIATAAVKNGTSCTVIGKTINSSGKTFVCTKSGKKKIYKLTDPYAGLSGAISAAAFDAIAAYQAKQPALPGSAVVMELSPRGSASLSKSTLADMQNGFKFWQAFTPTDTKIRMVFADRSDLKWFEEKMKSIDPSNTSWLARIMDLASSFTQGAYAGSNGKDPQGNALFFYLPGTATTPDSAGWKGVGPHEWTHFAQNTMSKDIRNAPCWFKEGQATYYGNAISNSDRAGWKYVWSRQIKSNRSDYSKFYTFTETDLKAWFDAHTLNMPDNVCGPDGAFMIGGIAVEYLVGTIGVEGVNNFLLLIGKGETWTSALTQAAGRNSELVMQDIYKFVLKQRDWSEKQ